MPERIAFRMNLFPGHAAEYEKRHDEIFPELADALKEAGILKSAHARVDRRALGIELQAMVSVRLATHGRKPQDSFFAHVESRPEVIAETLASTSSERQGRLIDIDGAASMERKKQEGYF